MQLDKFVQLLAKLPVKHRDTQILTPFILFPNQQKAMNLLAEQYERTRKLRAIFLKARRVTVSSLCDSYLFCDCLANPHRENLIVAHMKDTAEGLFRVPRDLANAINERANVCTVLTKSIEVKHRGGPSVLDIATAGTIASGRGLTLSGLHLSEAAQYPGQDSFLSLLPAVSKGDNSAIFVESTAFGKTGIGETFYNFWLSAVERKNEYIPIFLSWLDDPADVADEQLAADAPATDLEKELMSKPFNATKAQIAWMRNVLESECQGYEKKFLQEYPHTPSVAFQASNDPAFTPEEINFAETTIRKPIAEGHMENRTGHPRFVKVRGGALRIWEWPQPNCKYYAGMDAAVGMERGDFAAISIWNGTTGHQAAQYADKVVPETVAFHLNALGIWYNKALLNGELTGNSGREVLRVIRDRYHYPMLCTWKGKDDKVLGGKSKTPTLWWEMTGYSRRKLFDCFRMAVRQGMKQEDYAAIVHDEILWTQMANASLSEFGRWDTDTDHDDILVSAMLAVVAVAQNPVPRLSGQMHSPELVNTTNEGIQRIIPVIVDDATLSLVHHYRKAMNLTRYEGIRYVKRGLRQMGINRLQGI